MARDPLARVAAVRGWRVQPRELSIAPDLAGLLKGFAKQQAAVGGLSRAWETIVPPSLAAVTSVQSLSPSGILLVRAADSAAAWEFDQWLRGQGGEAAIRAAATKAIRRVRVSVGPLIQSPATKQAAKPQPRKPTRSSKPKKRGS